MSKLFLFAEIQIKPEYFEEAKAALVALVPPTLVEPGCHVFAPFVARDQNCTLHLIECFEDESALQTHYDQDYTKQVFAAYETWLAAPVKVTKMDSLTVDSDAVAALGDLT